MLAHENVLSSFSVGGCPRARWATCGGRQAPRSVGRG